MDFEIRKFDTNLERRIVVGMIVSAEFLAEAAPMFRPDLFCVPSLRMVAKWCVKYWDEYDKPPASHIQDIYESKRRAQEVTDEQAPEIEALLSGLSNEYIANPNLNHRYLLQQMERLMRSRSLLALGEDLVALARTENVEDAELVLAGYKPVAREGVSWSDPFRLSEEQQDAIFADGDVLFRFPGAVGDLIGPIERDSFIGVQAPEKRGKCLPGSERVLMSNGEYLPIRDVIDAKRTDIVSYDESSGKFVSANITEHWRNGIKPVCQVQTRTGRAVKVTQNHPFLTKRGWVEVEKLPVGEPIAVPEDPSKIYETKILWDQIVEISYVGEEETYDLSVDRYHNFVAENILVHNTWWLWEFALRAVLNRCNVAFFSVGDMSAPQNWRRVYGWVLRSSRKRAGQDVLVPILDCRLNQMGECRDCSDQDIVMESDGKLREFDETPDHKPCTRCWKEDPRRFVGSRWYKRERVPDFNIARAQNYIQQLSRRTGGKNIRLMCYPSIQTNVRTIRTMLDLWEKRDGWVADVVVIDYADILAPEDAREAETRHRINTTWAALRGLSTERSIAVITGTQSGRTSYNKNNQDMSDVSEDKRKLGHVTAMLALNQTADEKRAGLMRVSQLVVREDDFDSRANVVCLQCLPMSRPLLTSYWLK